MKENISSEKKQYFDLHKKRADNGNLESKYELALLLEAGQGTKIDQVEAFRLMLEVAQDNSERKKRVGGYKNGVFWDGFRVTKGIPESKYRLAHYYEKGIGTDINIQKAIEWYSLAVECGVEDAKKDIERLKKL